MTSKLCNPEYYRGTFLKIQKFMEVREESIEVQEETVPNRSGLYSAANMWTSPQSKWTKEMLWDISSSTP